MARLTEKPGVEPPAEPQALGAGAIDAYTRELLGGNQVDAGSWCQDWLSGGTAAPSEVAKLRTIDLIIRHRLTTRSLWYSAPADDSTTGDSPVEELSPAEVSDHSEPVSPPKPPHQILDDLEWLRNHHFEPIGYLDVKNGGMGEVALVWHKKMGKQLVLKVVTRLQNRKRFDREIKLHSLLEGHQNIVTSRTPEQHGEDWVLVVDYVKGLDLRRWVVLNGPMNWEIACRCVRQVAEGLKFAHGKGIIHRDIKSANLILSSLDGNVKILDWGLAFEPARVHLEDEPLTSVDRGIGTTPYLSPEQARDSRLATAASDLYGLGCVFYELLAGTVPFEGDRDTQLFGHAHLPVPRIAAERGVPRPVEELVRKLLNKQPMDRYPSAEVFIADLDRVLMPEVEIPVQPPPIVSRRVMAAGLGLGLVGGLAWVFVPRKTDVLKHSIEVARAPGGSGKSGILGSTLGEAHRGDELRIFFELSAKSHVYILSFRPDGVIELCAKPGGETTPPEATTSPSYPPPNGLGGVMLDEGPGLQVVALVVSRAPLPDFRSWLARKKPCPWQATRETDPGIVWYHDGEQLRIVSPPVKTGNDRKAGTVSRGVRGKLDALAAWLKEGPGGDLAVFEAFSVLD